MSLIVRWRCQIQRLPTWSRGVGLTAVMIAAFVLPAPVTGADAPPWERYELLLKRNIFSSARKEAPPPPKEVEPVETDEPQDDGAGSNAEPKPPAPPAPPPDPGADLVLTGIALIGGKAVAFIEDRAGGSMRRFVVGESVAERVIETLTLDELTWRRGSESMSVKVGRTLTGQMPAVASSTPRAGSTDSVSTDSAPGDATPLDRSPVATTARDDDEEAGSPEGDPGSSTGSQPTGSDAAAESSSSEPAQESLLERLRRRRREQLENQS